MWGVDFLVQSVGDNHKVPMLVTKKAHDLLHCRREQNFGKRLDMVLRVSPAVRRLSTAAASFVPPIPRHREARTVRRRRC